MMQESAPANPAISYLVGIGASAGGLEALQEFFQHMPADTQMAFVVIQHLSADYKSVMDELLQKQTAMAIKVVESPTTIEPNHIYLISSRSNLIIRKHALDVLEKDPAQRLNLPIDLFFHSLGEAYQERAVGIVLSGTGTDGSRGAKTIKENEGLVMVQQPEEARFDGMPNAIVSQGIADFVLPAAKLVAELARLAYHAPWLNAEQTLSENHGERMDPQLLRRILLEVKKQCKIDFTVYREQTILRRLNKRIRVLNLNSCEDYAAYLSSQAGEPRRLAREFMIGVTRFFRDEEAWELLRDRVLPELCASRNQDLPIRIWVAGCSSGEEAYSLAILLHEYLITHRLSLDFKLFATDIDEEAITFAGHGRYPESIFSSLSKERLYRYFDKEGDAYVIKKLIRDHIVFARHNLLTDPPFLKQDLITCRNLLVYLQPEAQRKILSTLHFALRLDGYLFLGKSESLGSLASLFHPVNVPLNVFRNIEQANSHQMLIENDWVGDRSEIKAMSGAPQRSADRQQDSRFYENTLLMEYVPTTLFVNRQGEVLYTHGNTYPFIMFPRGRLSYGLKSMLNEQEYTLIKSGMLRAQQAQQAIEYQSVSLLRGPESLQADICIRSLRQPELDEDVFLLEFRLAKEISRELVQVQSSDFNQEQLTAMRLEIQQKNQELSSLREKLETSNEELQAANEELLASNEELQSTNEELQSVNEELYTVNSELEAKLRALAELNNDLNNFLNSTQIGLIFLDKSLNIRRFTPSIRQVFNLYESDLGRSIMHFTMRFEQKFDLLAIADQVLREGRSYEQEVRVEQDQEYILKILPYVTLENSSEGVVMSLVNVTELNQVRRQAHRLDLRYQAIFDNIPDFVALTDLDGQVQLLNQRFEPNVAISALGKPVANLFGGQQQDYLNAMEQAIAAQSAVSISSCLDIRTQLLHFSHRICPLPGIGDDQAEIIFLSRDITAERQAEQRLRLALDELKRTNAYLDSFVYAAAHDLRAPVANLISILERMQRKPELTQEPMFPLLERSVRSLDQTLGGLIEIIDVQKMSGQAAREVDLNQLLDQILLSYPDLQSGQIGKLERRLEVRCVWFIEPYLHSILQNLIDNAVKYRHPSRVLQLEVSTVRAPDGMIVLTVSDNGMGVPPLLAKKKLFRAFQRYHKQVEGKGIGLYLVKTLVEKNGGQVDVMAAPDGGTRFVLGMKEYEQQNIQTHDS